MRKWTPVFLSFLAMALYLLTGSRSIQWQDSGQFTLRIGTGELYNDWGLAMVHPLHFWLGRLAVTLFPGNMPWAVTGVSALGGALSVGLVTLCVQRLTRNLAAALYAGGCLMLAHTFWRFSGMPEVYTLSAALLLLQAYGLIRLREAEGDPRWWLLILAANGLNWANHNLALLELAILGPLFLAALLRKTLTPARAAAAAGLWLLTSLPYTGLILQQMIVRGEVLPVVHSALFGYDFADQVKSLTPTPLFTAVTLAFLLLSFPLLPLILAAKSLPRLLRPHAPLLALLGIHLLFVLRYDVIDQYTFLIPAMGLLALLAGVGFAADSSRRLPRLAVTLLVTQPLLYALAPPAARATGVLRPFERNKPYRDDADYLLLPWTFRETSATRLATTAVSAAAPDGLLIVEDSMARYAVEWKRWRLGFAAIDLVSPAETGAIAAATDAGRRVVFAPARSQPPPENSGWQAEGEIWRLSPPPAPQPLPPEPSP